MYHLVTGLYAQWTRKERYNILILGLAAVGKSSLLEQIKSLYLHTPVLPPAYIVPTVGQNVFDLPLRSSLLHCWDLGGSPSVRSLWSKYYEESHAVVWVVDARDWLDGGEEDDDGKGKGKKVLDPDLEARRQRREDSWMTLSKILDHPSIDSIPILILANKLDSIPTSEHDVLTQTIKHYFDRKMSQQDDSDVDPSARRKGGVGSFGQRGYEWDVLATSALDGTGVKDAIEWLSVRVQSGRS